jgi:hypothetical protein
MMQRPALDSPHDHSKFEAPPSLYYPVSWGSAMNVADHFEVVGEHAVFRPGGSVTFAEATEIAAAAITLARQRQIAKLLMVATALTGFEPPTVADRYMFGVKCAQAAGGLVRLAVVARPEMIDKQGFGTTVARNRGLVAAIFTSEEDALAWLVNLT